jgi:hypothetical protein
MRIVVVLPAPLGPRKPTISPRWQVKGDRFDRRVVPVQLCQVFGGDHHFAVFVRHSDSQQKSTPAPAEDNVLVLCTW